MVHNSYAAASITAAKTTKTTAMSAPAHMRPRRNDHVSASDNQHCQEGSDFGRSLLFIWSPQLNGRARARWGGINQEHSLYAEG